MYCYFPENYRANCKITAAVPLISPTMTYKLRYQENPDLCYSPISFIQTNINYGLTITQVLISYTLLSPSDKV